MWNCKEVDQPKQLCKRKKKLEKLNSVFKTVWCWQREKNRSMEQRIQKQIHINIATFLQSCESNYTIDFLTNDVGCWNYTISIQKQNEPQSK